jgi:TPP-dependent pyruvate/acetoin dehydrogenase alpha subunit
METQRKTEVGVRVDWHQVARGMLRSRLLDELEEAELAATGEVPYQFSARGHELAQVLLALHLTHPHDAATVYYRSRPFMLACGLTLVEALAAGMGRTGSPSEGRDVGVVFSLPPPRAGPLRAEKRKPHSSAGFRRRRCAVHPGRRLGAGDRLPTGCAR